MRKCPFKKDIITVTVNHPVIVFEAGTTPTIQPQMDFSENFIWLKRMLWNYTSLALVLVGYMITVFMIPEIGISWLCIGLLSFSGWHQVCVQNKCGRADKLTEGIYHEWLTFLKSL